MTQQDWGEWDEVAKQVESGDYFKIEEGANKFILLSPIEPLPQVYSKATGKYRVAVEGDKNVSVKGVCWVLQNVGDSYEIKEAKLPYVVVKAIKGISEDPDWNFTLPFKHPLTLTATGAGTKEVKYTLTPSPKEFEVPADIIKELSERPTPKKLVEDMKEKDAGGAQDASEPSAPDYPEEEINPEDIPF